MAAIYRVDDSFDATLFKGASCAFGVFDGVHIGHRFIIGEALSGKRDAGAPVCIITFDIDPDELFRPSSLKKLMGNDARIAELAALPVDAVAVLPFTQAFAALDPLSFLEYAFCGHVPASVHVGRDFRFGSHAAGTVADLMAWGAPNGMQVCAYELLVQDGETVSSTRIRHLLKTGEVRAAADLLGRPYSLGATVVPGRASGRDMGFRTANMHIDDMHRVLGDGVYAAYADFDGKRYKAAVSVGVSPTFKDEATANVEAHILDFDGDLYGRFVELSFVEWLRPMMTFDSLDELVSTVTGNIDWVRSHL